jgi:radical SAM superfamily enzyme YgiQ (UPF0313 family)
MKENIKIIQELGIEIMGFFILGWDDDTLETYRQTLEFCNEMKIIPLIVTLTPMPGSQIYDEYLKEGRIFTDLSWDRYGGDTVVFKHPTMSPQEMFEANSQAFKEGYRTRRILSRTFHRMTKRFSVGIGLSSFLTQLAMRKGILEQIERIQN